MTVLRYVSMRLRPLHSPSGGHISNDWGSSGNGFNTNGLPALFPAASKLVSWLKTTRRRNARCGWFLSCAPARHRQHRAHGQYCDTTNRCMCRGEGNLLGEECQFLFNVVGRIDELWVVDKAHHHHHPLGTLLGDNLQRPVITSTKIACLWALSHTSDQLTST